MKVLVARKTVLNLKPICKLLNPLRILKRIMHVYFDSGVLHVTCKIVFLDSVFSKSEIVYRNLMCSTVSEDLFITFILMLILLSYEVPFQSSGGNCSFAHISA